MEFRKSKPVSLKTHDTYNEKWLQAQIADDPGLLGLGDLMSRTIERRQPRAGRLDLLLSDPETHTRYEVEIQLGATDESHIIRTIEYWDLGKSRYPQYEHVAVIVAEDITSRFLNVISLFNKAIPLIAIQLRARRRRCPHDQRDDGPRPRPRRHRAGGRARPDHRPQLLDQPRLPGICRGRRPDTGSGQRGHSGHGAEVQQALCGADP
jgi:hypothetical protein